MNAPSQAVHQPLGQDETSEGHAAPPDTPKSSARDMAELWARHLGDAEVGVDDDFFALGGNSLTGIKIIEQVSQEYGVQLSVRDFYLAQTPARVAALVEQGRAVA
ncbi:acyl carrier protein [Streptomyces sp. G44]|uniref:acyl carrier protein n=1 Tax=Streptomyces sp. G44 TaxID=2807632 RepID=UPI001961A87F|nr:acyl carrier protein [Streptomyces sp. G44]MBM7172989.1 acyl carrier protein [Streptomyces sp. G44]